MSAAFVFSIDVASFDRLEEVETALQRLRSLAALTSDLASTAGNAQVQADNLYQVMNWQEAAAEHALAQLKAFHGEMRRL